MGRIGSHTVAGAVAWTLAVAVIAAYGLVRQCSVARLVAASTIHALVSLGDFLLLGQ